MSRQSQPQEDRPDDSNWTPEAMAEYDAYIKSQLKTWDERYPQELDDTQEKQ